MQYPALFKPVNEALPNVPYLGPFNISFRDIPSVSVYAETYDEGMTKAKEALEDALESYLKSDSAIPRPSLSSGGERVVVISTELEARVAVANLMYPVFIRGNPDGTTTVRFRDIPELDVDYNPHEDSDQLSQVIRDRINNYVIEKLDQASEKQEPVDLPTPSPILTEEVYLYSLDFGLLVNVKISLNTPVLYAMARKLGIDLGLNEINDQFVFADSSKGKEFSLNKQKMQQMLAELNYIAEDMAEPIENYTIEDSTVEETSDGIIHVWIPKYNNK